MYEHECWQIKARKNFWDLELGNLVNYRELLLRLVRRDILTTYQQTIAGRAWIVLQPLLTTMIYVIIFGYFIKTSTAGVPTILFYLPGVILWNFFADIFTGTMYTFIKNADIFSKVYFPRIIVPLSIVLNQLVRLTIQFLLFLVIWSYYYFSGYPLHFSMAVFTVPLLILYIGLLALGLGLIASVLITRYRDLDNIFQFCLRILMFASPVVYSATIIPKDMQTLYWINPLTGAIEAMRSLFLTGAGIPVNYLVINIIIVLICALAGLFVFKRMELSITDVV